MWNFLLAQMNVSRVWINFTELRRLDNPPVLAVRKSEVLTENVNEIRLISHSITSHGKHRLMMSEVVRLLGKGSKPSLCLVYRQNKTLSNPTTTQSHHHKLRNTRTKRIKLSISTMKTWTPTHFSKPETEI